MNDPLDSIMVDVSDSRETSFKFLIDSWASHVERIRRESIKPDSLTSWGGHDYVAALHIRNMIEASWDRLPESVRARARADVDVTDESLREFTELCETNVISQFAGEPARSDWWWSRVPLTGPVREEIDHWFANKARREEEK